MARQAFILGGTGQIGCAVARNLLDRGWRVVVAHRGRRSLPTELIEGGARISIFDREQPGELARALADGTDALIDTIAFTQLHADQLLDVQGCVGSGTSRDAESLHSTSTIAAGTGSSTTWQCPYRFCA